MTPSNVVVRNIERADSERVRKLGDAGVATVHEAADKTGLTQPYLRPIYPGASVAGPAVTVLCQPGDNLMIHLALEVCLPGDVLVVATTSASTDGAVGELLATSMRARGVRGVVTDTGVRDVAELTGMRFPVWSRSVSAQGTFKATPGSVNVPVVCAGQLVRPGDAIVGDDDGVVCVPAGAVGDVVQRCEQRIDKEHAVRVRLADGELGADIYGLRETAAELGITYVDRPEPGGAATE